MKRKVTATRKPVWKWLKLRPHSVLAIAGHWYGYRADRRFLALIGHHRNGYQWSLHNPTLATFNSYDPLPRYLSSGWSKTLKGAKTAVARKAPRRNFSV